MRLRLSLALALLMVLAFGTSATSHAQEPLEVVSVEDCADGLIVSLNTTVSEDDVLVVGWAYADEVRGVAANGVFLTDLGAGEMEFVIPHVGVPVGDDAVYGAFLLDAATLASLPLLLGSVDMENPSEADMMPFLPLLEDVPAVGDEISVSDCSVEGRDFTQSNIEIDEAELEGFFEAFMGSGMMDMGE